MTLADQQREFATAALRGDGVYGQLLEAKRRAELAECLPGLARALGPRFAPAFAGWWRTSQHKHADFRTALIAAARALLRELPRAEQQSVHAELAPWIRSGRGPHLSLVDGILWWRLTPCGRLHGWRIRWWQIGQSRPADAGDQHRRADQLRQ